MILISDLIGKFDMLKPLPQLTQRNAASERTVTVLLDERISTRTHREHKTKKMSMVVRHKSADGSERYTPFVVVKGLPHPHENHPSDRSRVSRALEEALGNQHLLHDLVNNETRIHVMERTCMNSQSLNHRIGTCTRTRAYREARAARLAQQVERDLPDKVYQIKFKIRT